MTRRTYGGGWLIRGAVMVLLALAAVAAVAAEPDQATMQKQLAEAQRKLDAAAQEVARLSVQLYGEPERQIVQLLHGGPPGAVMGVNIGGPRERDEGVEVVGVSPGGPAEAAGLKAGDVIVAVDGEVLRKKDGRSPGAQLVAYMHKVEIGQTVKVQYLRDGKRTTVDVRTAAAQPAFVAMMGDRGVRPELGEGVLPPLIHETLFGAPGFGALELVPMTPGLGRYFGADKGLLVVRAPSTPGLGLADGDVLLDIDGRAPDSPGQAFRILRSYDPGDKIKLNVLRDRKRLSIDATLPEPEPEGQIHPRRIPAPPPAAPPRPPQPAASADKSGAA